MLDLSHECRVDERDRIRVATLDGLLDDVVAVEVLDQLNNIIAHGVDDHLSLLRGGDELDHLLESAGTMLVQRDLNELGSRVVNEGGALLVVGVLEKLLAQVVAERIYIDEKKTN